MKKRSAMRGRGQQRTPRRRPRSVPDPVLAALLGAIAGAILGCLFLLVGLGRAVLVLLGGRSVGFEDLHLMLYYVAGFTVGGGLMGLLLFPLSHVPGRRYVICVVGAASVFGALALGDAGPISGWDRSTWVGTLLLTLSSASPSATNPETGSTCLA